MALCAQEAGPACIWACTHAYGQAQRLPCRSWRPRAGPATSLPSPSPSRSPPYAPRPGPRRNPSPQRRSDGAVVVMHGGGSDGDVDLRVSVLFKGPHPVLVGLGVVRRGARTLLAQPRPFCVEGVGHHPHAAVEGERTGGCPRPTPASPPARGAGSSSTGRRGCTREGRSRWPAGGGRRNQVSGVDQREIEVRHVDACVSCVHTWGLACVRWCLLRRWSGPEVSSTLP